MTRYAIGDLQGCHDELQQLLRRIGFSADRDQLQFVGDLVNRGPYSLGTLRTVRALVVAGNAVTVLGNHDLHLVAHCVDRERPLRPGDTLQPILDAPDRSGLCDWLLQQPLAIHDPIRNELLVHAGLVPAWTAAQAAQLAREASQALQADPAGFIAGMYGNEPDQWQDSLTGAARWRFTVNSLTRLRFCTADSRLDLKRKGGPDSAPPPWAPWFAHTGRASAGTRIVFGHWSTLGLRQEPGLLALDTGCVWGGSLTAVDLDDEARPAIQVASNGHRRPDGD
jgi:bis(5'-nucleosyl)-tetraphosphatase (symmetrical)